MTTSSQAGRVVDEVRTLLAAQGDPETLRRLIPASIRLHAEGEPLTPVQIADAAGVPVDQAEAALRGIDDIEWTADIAVSWFFDAAATGFRASVCQFGHFFASRESAAEWAAKYPQGGVLTLDEAMDASRSLVAEMFGPKDGAER